MSTSRHLAAIMFTDIAGYTAIMGKDEQLAFELLDINRTMQRPIIENYQGKWIKEIGDGIMSSFVTVTEAVYAALEIQKACSNKPGLKLRIGIHLGEVVFENEDVFGDGVNIAARIQAITPPGEIYISEVVQNNISNRNDLQTGFVKVETLKNVKDPVRIYRVHSKDGSTPSYKKIIPFKKYLLRVSALLLLLAASVILYKYISGRSTTKQSMHNERSIAILPFTDMSPGKDQGYLSEGLAQEISNSITIITGLKVIGPSSALKFTGKDITTKHMGEVLNVGVVLQGSIQKAGDKLRIIAELVSTSDNSIIWSQRFDKDMKDIFAIQDTIAKKIVDKLRITLTASEGPRLIKRGTTDEVYSLYLKGMQTYKQAQFDESIRYNLEAIARDSSFASSYAVIALSKTWLIYKSHDYLNEEAIQSAREYANRAILLDPYLAEAYSALALLAWTVELDYPVAKINFEKSIELNPSASLIINRYGYFLLWMKDLDKATQMGRNGIEADPADFNGYVVIITALIYQGKFREAANYIREGRKLFPDNKTINEQSLELSFISGDYDKVIQTVEPLFKNLPDNLSEEWLGYLSISYEKIGKRDKSENLLQLIKSRIDKKGVSSNYCAARIYSIYGMTDSCLACLNRSLLKREPDFKMLKIDPLFDKIRMNEGFIRLYRLYHFDRYK